MYKRQDGKMVPSVAKTPPQKPLSLRPMNVATLTAIMPGAVSYTHLDVYKRQVFIFNDLHDIVRVCVELMSHAVNFHGQIFIGDLEVFLCLLYTSLPS